ncbi:hypothetical protein KEM56_003288, partial [Ascosphaera pollenicola]
SALTSKSTPAPFPANPQSDNEEETSTPPLSRPESIANEEDFGMSDEESEADQDDSPNYPRQPRSSKKRKIQKVTDWYTEGDKVELPESCTCGASQSDVKEAIGTRSNLTSDARLKEVLAILENRGLLEKMCNQHCLLFCLNAKLDPKVSYSVLIHCFRSIAETPQSLSTYRRGRSSWFENSQAATAEPSRKKVKTEPSTFFDTQSLCPEPENPSWDMNEYSQTELRFPKLFGYWRRTIETKLFGQHLLSDYVQLEAAIYCQHLLEQFPPSTTADPAPRNNIIPVFYSIGQQLIQSDYSLYWTHAAMNPDQPHMLWYPTVFEVFPSAELDSRSVDFRNTGTETRPLGPAKQ